MELQTRVTLSIPHWYAQINSKIEVYPSGAHEPIIRSWATSPEPVPACGQDPIALDAMLPVGSSGGACIEGLYIGPVEESGHNGGGSVPKIQLDCPVLKDRQA